MQIIFLNFYKFFDKYKKKFNLNLVKKKNFYFFNKYKIIILRLKINYLMKSFNIINK